MPSTETELLPDSRLRDRSKHAMPGPGGYWVPVYCAVCGVPYGYVPEENCTFACWLCNYCSEAYGAIFGTMMMPDEVFWEKVRQAQLERYGRLLTDRELTQVADDSN